jgi:phosphate transport system permease protein
MKSKTFRRIWEFIIERLILFAGILTIIFVCLIFIFLSKDSAQLFKTVGITDFLFGRNWYPISDPAHFGVLPLILGSLAVTLGAIIISVPLGVACAVYIGEVAPPAVREILKPLVELLAAIPSVVLGFIGIVTLVPLVKNAFNLSTGLTALTGSIILAFMAMPTIVSITEDALNMVPASYKEASLALGATKWQTISRVVVPAASSGIIAAIMLGLGRVIGETMAVMMVTGNAAVIPYSLLRPVRTMTATIAAEMGETVHQSEHYFALFAIGALLFIITLMINLSGDWFVRRMKR